MAVVVYKCDVCNRVVEIPQNKRGLETVGHCVITDGCRGKLYQTDYKIDHVIGKFPDAVEGLDDWDARKVLFNYQQTIASISWSVSHNLGVRPSVQVFIERQVSRLSDTNEDVQACDPLGETSIVTELFEADPDTYTITIVNENELTVNFDVGTSGFVQCIARSARPATNDPIQPVVDTSTQYAQITANGELTIATLDSEILPATNIIVSITYIKPDGTTLVVPYAGVDENPSLVSPWSDVNKIFVGGKSYTIRSFPIFQPGILDGDTFFIDSIDALVEINTDDVLVVLSQSPHDVVDKIYDKIVDVSNINVSTSSSFIFDKGELLAAEEALQTVFPHITTI